jgi:hypothetical protein
MGCIRATRLREPTDIAGVQPTGSIESRAALGGFIIVTSAFRFSIDSQLPLALFKPVLVSFSEALWIISISRCNVSAMRG